MKRYFSVVAVVVVVVLLACFLRGLTSQSDVSGKKAYAIEEEDEYRFQNRYLKEAVENRKEIKISEDYVAVNDADVSYHFYHDGIWDILPLEFSSVGDRCFLIDELIPMEDALFFVLEDMVIVKIVS